MTTEELRQFVTERAHRVFPKASVYVSPVAGLAGADRVSISVPVGDRRFSVTHITLGYGDVNGADALVSRLVAELAQRIAQED